MLKHNTGAVADLLEVGDVGESRSSLQRRDGHGVRFCWQFGLSVGMGWVRMPLAAVGLADWLGLGGRKEEEEYKLLAGWYIACALQPLWFGIQFVVLEGLLAKLELDVVTRLR